MPLDQLKTDPDSGNLIGARVLWVAPAARPGQPLPDVLACPALARWVRAGPAVAHARDAFQSCSGFSTDTHRV